MQKTVSFEMREARGIQGDVETVTGKGIDEALEAQVEAVRTVCDSDNCGAFFKTDVERDVPISIPTGLGGDDLEGTRDYWRLTYGCSRGADCGCANGTIKRMIGGLLDTSVEAVQTARIEGQKIREEGEEEAQPLLEQIEVIRTKAGERVEERTKEIYEETVSNLASEC